jgi:superfamily II DNA/RNA helicase
MPGPVVTLARRFMSRPVHVRAEMPDEGRTVPTTSQHVFRAHAMDKVEMLARILQADGRGLAMVFCRTKRTCDKVAGELADRGFAAAAVHGDLGQGQREQALRAFRAGKIDVLVATDVAARGIDVGGVTHVVNYQCPEDEKIYLHRIGRTGRAGGSGTAITLVDWDDIPRWQLINKALELPFPDPPETYSSSAHLFETLDIPREAKGTLPRGQRTRAGLGAEEVEDLGETGRRRRAAGGPDPASGPGRSPRRSERKPEPRSTDAGEPSAGGRRRRTRTRSGEPVLQVVGADTAPEPASQNGRSGSGEAAAESSAGDSGEGAPRRRRRRGGRGRGRSGGESDATSQPAEQRAD